MIKELFTWIAKYVEVEVDVQVENSDPWGWYYSTRWNCWFHTSELEYAWSNTEGWRGFWVVSEPGLLVWGNELFTKEEIKTAQRHSRKARRQARRVA